MTVEVNPLIAGFALDSVLYASTPFIRVEEMGATPSSSAAVNTSAIQQAFDRANALGGATVTLTVPGVYLTNATLLIYSDTTFYLGPGVTIKLADGSQCLMLQNYAYTVVGRLVGGITVVGTLATVNIPGHGRAVNDWVAIVGSSTSGINGAFQVVSVVDADNYKIRLEMVPSATTALGTITERAADHDISLIGDGYWDGNKQNRVAAGTIQDSGMVLAFAGRVHLELNGLNHLQRMVTPACMNGLTGRAFASNSVATLVLNCPMFNLDMEEIVGVDQTDDIFGFQGGDYNAYEVSQGDGVNCKVGFIAGRTDNSAIKIAGTAGFVLDLEVGEIFAESLNSLVKMSNDSLMVSTGLDLRRLRIGHIEHINPATNTFTLNVARDTGTPIVRHIEVGSARVRVAAGVAYSFLCPDNTNCSILLADLNNLDIVGATANQSINVVRQIGAVTNCNISNLYLENALTIWNHDSAGSESGQQLKLLNCTQHSCSAGVSTRRSMFVHNAGGWILGTALQTAAFSSTGGTITFSGDMPIHTYAGNQKIFNLPAGTPGFQYLEGDVTMTLAQLTSAQILALNATPVAIVAAPGANMALEFERAELFLDYNSAAYAGIAAGEDLEIRYTDGSGTMVSGCETTGFLDQTSDQLRYLYPQSAAATGLFELTPTVNAALVIRLASGEVTTGNSPIYVRTWTRVRNVLRALG